MRGASCTTGVTAVAGGSGVFLSWERRRRTPGRLGSGDLAGRWLVGMSACSSGGRGGLVDAAVDGVVGVVPTKRPRRRKVHFACAVVYANSGNENLSMTKAARKPDSRSAIEAGSMIVGKVLNQFE